MTKIIVPFSVFMRAVTTERGFAAWHLYSRFSLFPQAPQAQGIMGLTLAGLTLFTALIFKLLP